MRNPANRYNQFHGHRPRKYYRTRFHIPISLIRLGKVTRIEYESDKNNGGGDGRLTTYYHDHNSPVYLYMDETGKKQLYLIGSKLKVTRAGIEN